MTRALALLFTLALLTATACDLNGNGIVWDGWQWSTPTPTAEPVVCPEGEQRGFDVQCSAFISGSTFELWGTCIADNVWEPSPQGAPPIVPSFRDACTSQRFEAGPYTSMHLRFDLGGLIHEGFTTSNPSEYAGGAMGGPGGPGGLYLAPGYTPPDPIACAQEFIALGSEYDPQRGEVLPISMLELTP